MEKYVDGTLGLDYRDINNTNENGFGIKIKELLSEIFKISKISIFNNEVKKYTSIIDDINKLEEKYSGMCDTVLKEQTQVLRNQYQNEFDKRTLNKKNIPEEKEIEYIKRIKNQVLNELLPDAFAIIREVSKRTLGLRHFDVQLLGGIALHNGKIAEMKTSEGKTLVATLPAFLNSLTGESVHIVTANDYLVKRDAYNMGEIFNFLGLTVGAVTSDDQSNTDSLNEKKKAYSSDIVYGTYQEFGFDYLRDNLTNDNDYIVQLMKAGFCIIDEIDNILLDEATTPLIISENFTDDNKVLKQCNMLLNELQNGIDYLVDNESKKISLTEIGISNIENILGKVNIYSQENMHYIHSIDNLLYAHVFLKKDVDYVVLNNNLILVDKGTGRLAYGKTLSNGLHQALQVKENLIPDPESIIEAMITAQNYFLQYEKLSGMTATASSSKNELKKIYNLDIIKIPTHKKVIRKDLKEIPVFETLEKKYHFMINDILNRNTLGQPVLIGTGSIYESEAMSEYLERIGLDHNVLNAKNHREEAEIIKNAGDDFSITISTNMAGRGTDIKLKGDKSYEKGLHVIGASLQNNKRLDLQLCGRAGRQGENGSSQFFISLDDEIFREIPEESLQTLKKGLKENPKKYKPKIIKLARKLQENREQKDFSYRKQNFEFDRVLHLQRSLFYEKRLEISNLKSVDGLCHDIIKDNVCNFIENLFNKKNISEQILEFKDLFGDEIFSLEIDNIIKEIIEIDTKLKINEILLIEKSLKILKIDIDSNLKNFQEHQEFQLLISNLINLRNDFKNQSQKDIINILIENYNGLINTKYYKETKVDELFKDMIKIFIYGAIPNNNEYILKVINLLIIKIQETVSNFNLLTNNDKLLDLKEKITFQLSNVSIIREKYPNITESDIKELKNELYYIDEEQGTLFSKFDYSDEVNKRMDLLIDEKDELKKEFNYWEKEKQKLISDFFKGLKDFGNKENIKQKLTDLIIKKFDDKKLLILNDSILLIKNMLLSIMNEYWANFLITIEAQKEGIHYRSYAQKNPIHEFIKESYDMFNSMEKSIKDQFLYEIFYKNNV